MIPFDEAFIKIKAAENALKVNGRVEGEEGFAERKFRVFFQSQISTSKRNYLHIVHY